jgi:hypothetical protein
MATSIELNSARRVEPADASTVIADHMQRFAFERSPGFTVQELVSANSRPSTDQNRTVLNQMQEQSSAVRDLYQVHSLPLAESLQQRVVETADKLDSNALCTESRRLRGLAGGVSEPRGKAAMLKNAEALATAGASPFIERARLAAIQLSQGNEDAAEKTFADAIKKGVPPVSLGNEKVRQLQQAVIERHEELKVKRTLPEVFKANIDWLDSSRDGRVDMNELKSAAGKTRDITASSLVGYLMNNYDNIDKGVKGLEPDDVRTHWQVQRDKQYKF